MQDHSILHIMKVMVGLKRTYRKKQWLIKVADRVQSRSEMYQKQYWGCAKDLKKKRFFIF